MRRQHNRIMALHRHNINPLQVCVVIRPGPFRKGGSIFFDIARLVDILHLVFKAVEITQQLAEKPTPNLVTKDLDRHLYRFIKAACSISSPILCQRTNDW